MEIYCTKLIKPFNAMEVKNGAQNQVAIRTQFVLGRDDYDNGYANLNKYVLSWLLKWRWPM